MQEVTASSCVVCDHEITNPICPDCLAARMRTWLQEVEPSLVGEVDGFELAGEVNCISCGNAMGICAHCFSKDVYEQIKVRDETVAEEFLSRFDFDLRREIV
jgi:hypothetical protein